MVTIALSFTPTIAFSAVGRCKNARTQMDCVKVFACTGVAESRQGTSSNPISLGGPVISLVEQVEKQSNDAEEGLSLDVTAGSTRKAEVAKDLDPNLHQPKLAWFAQSEEEKKQYIDRAINATIAAAAASFALTKILTVDQDYWHGWTMYEILRYAPLHNWLAYEVALQDNPVLAKMIISGIVYSLGDWIAQCYEGKPILDFNRVRMIRSGLVGFCLHGSLSHFYYHLCEAIFPFKDWWVVPLKVLFDQTVWSAFWNSVYYVTLGVLRFESPVNIFSELRSTFLPLLTAGWKLWPFAHLITYGVVPVEQRLLWVDTVELIWVTILSMYSNEKAEARMLEEENVAAAKQTSLKDSEQHEKSSQT